MGNGLVHGLLAVLLIAIVVVYLRSGKRPEPYRLSQKWTRPPVLWTATDEVIPALSTGGPSVGGGASGRW